MRTPAAELVNHRVVMDRILLVVPAPRQDVHEQARFGYSFVPRGTYTPYHRPVRLAHANFVLPYIQEITPLCVRVRHNWTDSRKRSRSSPLSILRGKDEKRCRGGSTPAANQSTPSAPPPHEVRNRRHQLHRLHLARRLRVLSRPSLTTCTGRPAHTRHWFVGNRREQGPKSSVLATSTPTTRQESPYDIVRLGRVFRGAYIHELTSRKPVWGLPHSVGCRVTPSANPTYQGATGSG